MIKISVITSLYHCEKYLSGYFEALDKILNKEECEFLLLHNDPNEEELLLISKEIEGKIWFRHIIIENREGLYTTWNRGVNIARGKYCAVWNVDDVRFPDSLVLQANFLNFNSEYSLVTGYMYGTDIYGERGDYIHKYDILDINPEEAFRRCLIGCFPMWRKSVHNTIGYFDEQFKCVSDFDFQIRVNLHFRIYCIPNFIGIYLENDPNKISNNGLKQYENNIV